MGRYVLNTKDKKIDAENSGAKFASEFFCFALEWTTERVFPAPARRLDMEREEMGLEELGQEELLEELRRLAAWRNNDVVKLAFLDGEAADQVDALDLSGVVELKRNANGTFEAKFVDKVRVLTMIRELMEERRDGELGAFLDGLCRDGEADEG